MRLAVWGSLLLAIAAARAARSDYRWTYYVQGDELVSEWALEREPDGGAPIEIPEPSGLLVFAAGLVTIRRAARCARSC
jgi:hypothetical protein